jgi:CheY-like chemotaxis protein
MPIHPLNLLLALLLVALVVGGLALWRAGRRPPAPPAPAGRPAAATPGPAQPPQATAAAPALPPAPVAPPPAAAVPLQADLLLVDDSAVVRAKLRRLFEPAGYRVALARDGAEALVLLGQGRYGLLVTDLEMPQLDGLGLVRATLALPTAAAMPILAITGHEDLQAQLNQLQAVAGIYRKPWIDEDLLSHVQALVQPSGVPADQGETA